MRVLQQTKQKLIRALSERIVENPFSRRALRLKFVPFDMVFTDLWQGYLKDCRPNVAEKLDVLCEGMDEISAQIAATVAERYFYIAPPCRFDDDVCYRTDRLFTDYERALQAEVAGLMPLRERQGYWLPEPNTALSISVFAKHNGLDFIPDARRRLPGSTVIDGGAFVGDSALAINEFQPKMIYCFEPDESNRSYVRQTIAHNALKNVTLVEAGLGSAEGRATVRSDASATKLLPSDSGVQVVTIDAFCKERNIAPSLIKLDVEGMEYDVIQGSMETIKRHKPLLIISIYHTPKDFFEIKPILQNLDLDYRFMIRRLDPFHPTNETVLICH